MAPIYTIWVRLNSPSPVDIGLAFVFAACSILAPEGGTPRPPQDRRTPRVRASSRTKVAPDGVSTQECRFASLMMEMEPAETLETMTVLLLASTATFAGPPLFVLGSTASPAGDGTVMLATSWPVDSEKTLIKPRCNSRRRACRS